MKIPGQSRVTGSPQAGGGRGSTEPVTAGPFRKRVLASLSGAFGPTASDLSNARKSSFGTSGNRMLLRSAYVEEPEILLRSTKRFMNGPTVCQHMMPIGPMTNSDLEHLGMVPSGAQVVRDAPAKPVDSGLGMLPGTRHRKGHVYHPCVPLGQPEVADFAGILCASIP